MGYFDSIYASGLSHKARTVYMYLKDRCGGQSRCWPAIRTIAEGLGIPSSGPWRSWNGRAILRRSPAEGKTAG